MQDGRSPLHIAVDNNLAQIAKLLIEKGADVNAFTEARNQLKILSFYLFLVP